VEHLARVAAARIGDPDRLLAPGDEGECDSPPSGDQSGLIALPETVSGSLRTSVPSCSIV
jgi:hypothetical protein